MDAIKLSWCNLWHWKPKADLIQKQVPRIFSRIHGGQPSQILIQGRSYQETKVIDYLVIQVMQAIINSGASFSCSFDIRSQNVEVPGSISHNQC